MIEMENRKAEQEVIKNEGFVALFKRRNKISLPFPVVMKKRIITPRPVEWDCYTNREGRSACGNTYEFIYPLYWSEVIDSGKDIEQACREFNQAVWESIGDKENVVFWLPPTCTNEMDGRKRLTCRFGSF